MKKICAMVLALCMILSLAGCGGTSGASAFRSDGRHIRRHVRFG